MEIVSRNRFTAPFVAQALSEGTPDGCVVDLSAANWVDPCGLVTIAAVVERCRLDRGEIRIKLPTHADPRIYLSRMHLREALADIGVEVMLRPVAENPVGDRLLELHRFDETSCENLAEKVHSILSTDDPVEAAELYTSVSDALANVPDHSRVSHGWAALQQYGRGSERTVQFAVADCGIGLRCSLSAVRDVTSDEEAIELAVTEGISGTGLANRGLGLSTIADTARRRSGGLRMLSGRAEGMTLPNGRMHTKITHVSYPGTIIHATMKYTTRR